MRVKASRALGYTAAARLDAGEEAREDCSIAKHYATQAAFEVADMALQVHGGLGYSCDYPVERIFRDTRLCSIGGGANEVMLQIIAKDMGLMSGHKSGRKTGKEG